MSQSTAGAIAQITDVVARVTRILSGRSIQVVQEGMKLGVEYDREGAPNKVFLPSISENPSPELLVAIQGFVDKEVSTLLYTEHEYRCRMRGTEEFGKGMAKSLQSIIEDSRTEREMKKEFRGSAYNFQRNHDFAVKEVIEPKHATEHDKQKRMANLAMPAIRAACGDLAYEEFMDGKWEELGNIGSAILHYADQIQEVESTRDTYELTRKIMRMVEDLEKGEGSGCGDDEGEGESEGDGEGEGEGGAGGYGADESDYDDPEGEGGGEGEAEGDPGDGEPPESKHENLDKKNKNLKQQKEKKNPKPSGMSGMQQGLSKFDKLDDAFEAADWNAAYQEKIKKLAKDDQTGAKYIPYSRQYDYVGPYPEADKTIKRFGTDHTAQMIYKHAKENSHVIQQQIQKLFMAKALVRWDPGLRRGKINSTSLYKLRTGDDRVFRKKIESNSRDVAVSLVIDMSGSMSNSKVQYACIAAMMFSQVLTTLNIAHEISAFTTYAGEYGDGGKHFPKAADVNAMLESVGSRYSRGTGSTISYGRYAPIANYIAKGFEERLTEEVKKLVCMIPSGYRNMMANNVDGESVDTAGRRLLGRKEKRKIMIVMSDGSPASDGDGRMLHSHLKSVVKSYTDAGVEMLGLGLMDHSVKEYYPKSEIVMKAEEIPSKILELTKRMVVGA